MIRLSPEFTGLELMGEQRTQDSQHYPQHGRANENKKEQENQHNGGINEKLNHYINPFPKEVSTHQKAYHA